MSEVRPEAQVQTKFQQHIWHLIFFEELRDDKVSTIVEDHIHKVTTKVHQDVLLLEVGERKDDLNGSGHSQKKAYDLGEAANEAGPGASISEEDVGGGEELRGEHHVGVHKWGPQVR